MKYKTIFVITLIILNSIIILAQRELPSCDHCLIYEGLEGGSYTTLSGECYCTWPSGMHFVGLTYDCINIGGWDYCEKISCDQNSIYCEWIDTP